MNPEILLSASSSIPTSQLWPHNRMRAVHAVILLGVSSALPPPVRPVRVVPTWPPSRASSTHIWVEGTSAGPAGRAADRLFENRFRQELVAELGRDVPIEGFAGVMRLCLDLVRERGPGVSAASRRVLTSLFPNLPPLPPDVPSERKGLLYWFEVLFARPFPAFSSKLNAWVTWWAAQWLMGPCTIEDLDDRVDELHAMRASGQYAAAARVGDGRGQQLLVHRCRFLEEAACASVCVNVCKMPTQAFFNEEMVRRRLVWWTGPSPRVRSSPIPRSLHAQGVAMRMEPDYETLECRFKFGLPPTANDEADARSVGCFAACPSAGSLREKCHTMGDGDPR